MEALVVKKNANAEEKTPGITAVLNARAFGRALMKKKFGEKRLLQTVELPAETIMLPFQPTSTMCGFALGFDGCGDGGAKFVLPPGYEFDQKLEELLEDLNAVQKPKVAPVNLATLVSVLVTGGGYTGAVLGLNQMVPVMLLAFFGLFISTTPLIFMIRFYVKNIEVERFIRRLQRAVPFGRGVVHSEQLEFNRWEVWKKTYLGHRTGLTQRTAIALELKVFHPDDPFRDATAEKTGEQPVEKIKKKELMDDKYVQAEALDEQLKINGVTEFLRKIELGRLASTIRRNRLTFTKISKLTDLEWRNIGVDRTECKIIKTNMRKYGARDPDLNQLMEEHAKKIEVLRQMQREEHIKEPMQNVPFKTKVGSADNV